MRSALTAPFVASALAAPATATPKRGGTLTSMIPADAPSTLDGHRETTYATVHAAAKGWKISPSHYVNQDPATIWLDE